jgi:hypothetical protein
LSGDECSANHAAMTSSRWGAGWRATREERVAAPAAIKCSREGKMLRRRRLSGGRLRGGHGSQERAFGWIDTAGQLWWRALCGIQT